MDVKTKPIVSSIIEETFDEVVNLAKRRNSPLDNVVNDLLRRGLADTYRQWPNLRSKQND